MSWLLPIVLQRTLEYMYLCESWFSLNRCPGVGWLDQMVVLFLVFWGLSILFSTVVAPFDPAVPLLGIYSEKTMTRKDTRTPMFTAALYTITKTWKQPKCPLTEEWIKKMWYIYPMEYYSAIKRNEISAFLATWMDLEIIMLSEVSHTMRHQHQILSLNVEFEKRTEWTSLQNRCWLTDFEKLTVSRGDSLVGVGDALGVWDGNPIKFISDDHCTTINVINSLSNIKKETTFSKKSHCIKVLIPFI